MVPEFELFDLGHVHALRRLLDTYGLPYGGQVHVDFVMGVPGGMPGTTGRAGRRRRDAAGRGDVVVGHRHRPLHLPSWRRRCRRAATCGSAWRTTSIFARGQVVQHNDELVARAAELATVMQRPPMGTDAGARAARGQGPARALTLGRRRRRGIRGRRARVRGLDGLVARRNAAA